MLMQGYLNHHATQYQAAVIDELGNEITITETMIRQACFNFLIREEFIFTEYCTEPEKANKSSLSPKNNGLS